MESQSTIIGVVIALIIILPLILLQLSQKSKKKKSKESFINEALKSKLKISDPDFWGTYYAIAIDEMANKIIYSKIIEAKQNITIIDLSQVNSCEIVKTHRTFKNKTTNKIETDRIDLVIGYKTASNSKKVLEFYNVDINIEMSNEIELLEKWETKIKNRIIKKVQAA
ncbi:hypothetical protein [Formosa maritima]|uniref:Uncharacterized protein n=1 Tax=Formosa maritima TaxID=2592046 RepID=A0A5D0GDF7_9FLAO|nr:hypothetical protein [Formosa maritima]TYA56339.1 hypothetical protein FVF61_06260 [Formosa maritima]